MARNGEGKEILGQIKNRPEDLEISMDRKGEEILENLLKKHNISAFVFSEQENREIKTSEKPEIYGSIDPFDGSMLYLNGWKYDWYTALTFFDKERNPICSGVMDILNDKYYITEKEGNYSVSKKEKKEIKKSDKKDLKGKVVISSYIMSSRYSKKFIKYFGDMITNLDPMAIFYPNGGCYIYAFLAAGLVDAYVMFDEPRSEIDPGYVIAKKAGCSIVSVKEDGSFTDYEFVPGKQHDKIDLLVATSTPELRDEIIKHYISKK